MSAKPLEDRLWGHGDKNGPVPAHRPELGPCWLWGRWCHPSGYGGISKHGHWVAVHRLVYEMLVGPIPEGLTLDHLCRVRHCCNPQHLEPVTCAVNLLRGVGASAQNARKTHCVHGHPLTEDNLLRPTPSRPGARLCRACKQRSDREYRLRHLDAMRAKGVAWQAAHRAELRDYYRAYYLARKQAQQAGGGPG
jgi:hypothetical protein